MRTIQLLCLLLTATFTGSAQHILDLRTGELTPCESVEDVSAPVRTVSEINGGYLVTYDIPEAYVHSPFVNTNAVEIVIPGFTQYGANYEPQLPVMLETLNIEPYKYADITLKSTEINIINVSDIDIEVAGAPYFNEGIGPEYATEITPYSGLFPDYIIGNPQILNRSAVFWIAPLNYDYEAKQIHACYQMTIEIKGKTSGIEEISDNQADGNVEYYNLHGVRVSNPTKGVYLRHQGSRWEKVVL